MSKAPRPGPVSTPMRRRVHPRRRSRRATALIAGNNAAGPISRLPGAALASRVLVAAPRAA